MHLDGYFYSCSTVVGLIALNGAMVCLLFFREGGDEEKEKNDTQMLIKARRKTEWKSGNAALQV
jgi:hypothetical protein